MAIKINPETGEQTEVADEPKERTYSAGWRGDAERLLGGQADAVKSGLAEVDASFDWGPYIQGAASGYGEDDLTPGRGSSWGIVKRIVSDAAQTPAGSRFKPTLSALGQREQQQGDEIRAAQNVKDDDLGGLGGILGIAATVAGFALGIPAPITAAFKAIVSGGENLLGSIASAFLPSVGSFFGEAAGAASDFAAAMDAADAAAGALGGESLAGTIAGVAPDISATPRNIMLENSVASGGVSDVSPGMTLSTAAQPAGDAMRIADDAAGGYASAATGSDAARMVDDVANGNPGALPGGDGARAGFDPLKWFKENDKLATAGAQLIFGAMKGVGDREAMKDIENQRTQRSMEILAQQQKNAQDMAEWNRRFTQAGDIGGARPAVSANGTATLRRPDGTPVYQGGLISTRMG